MFYYKYCLLIKAEFNGLIICSTGFTGVDLLHLSKLVKLMGKSIYDATSNTQFSRGHL